MFFGLSLRVFVTSVSALLVWGWWGWAAGAACLFGGGVALLSSGLLVWRWHRGLRDYHCDGGRHLRSFYRSALERFVVVGILLAAGFAMLNLAPLPLLSGFIVGQLAWVIAVAVHMTD